MKEAAQGRRSPPGHGSKWEGEGRLHNAIAKATASRDLGRSDRGLTSGQSEVNLHFGIYLHGFSVE